MEQKIRITKEFNFETGHALHGYDGLCKNVHGHKFKTNTPIIEACYHMKPLVVFLVINDFAVIIKNDKVVYNNLSLQKVHA